MNHKHMDYTTEEKVLGTALGCGIAAAILIPIWALGSWLFMFLFNVVSHIFNGPTITWFQALCLWFLISLIGSCFKNASSK